LFFHSGEEKYIPANDHLNFMIKNNFVVSILFFSLIVIAGWFFFKNNNNTLNSNEAAFALKDTSVITSIVISKNDSSLTFSRSGGYWRFYKSYIANPSLMDICFRVISQVEIKSAIPKKKLIEISDKIKQKGSEIKIYQKNKLIRNYYIYPDYLTKSIYMMMKGSNKPFQVLLPSFQGNFAAVFRIDTNFWRDLSVIRYSPAQINYIKVEQTGNPKQSFILQTSKKEKIILSDLISGQSQKFNSEAVEAYLFCFRNVKIVKYIGNEKKIFDQLLKTQPSYIITIREVSGNLKVLKTYPFNKISGSPEKENIVYFNDYCYLLLNDQEIAIVKFVEIDPLTRDLDFFTH